MCFGPAEFMLKSVGEMWWDVVGDHCAFFLVVLEGDAVAMVEMLQHPITQV